MDDDTGHEPGTALAALASVLGGLGGAWLQVRPRPYGRGALAHFWLPTRVAADRFADAVPRSWEVTMSRHLRRSSDTTYHGWQVRVTVPVYEVAAARRVMRRRGIPGPTGELTP